MEYYEDFIENGSGRLSLTIGEKMKMYRVARKLSIKELSKRSGITGCAISRCESNKASPKIETINKLALFYGFSSANDFLTYINKYDK